MKRPQSNRSQNQGRLIDFYFLYCLLDGVQFKVENPLLGQPRSTLITTCSQHWRPNRHVTSSNCHDNASMESIFFRLKTEALCPYDKRTVYEAQRRIKELIHFYTIKRPQ